MTGTRARALSRSRSPAPLIHPKRLWSFFTAIIIYPKGWKNRTGDHRIGALQFSFSAVTGMSTAGTIDVNRAPFPFSSLAASPPRRSVSPGARRCPESAACRHFGETRQLTATATSSQLPGLNERLIGSEKFFNCSAGIGRRRLPSRRVRSGSESGGPADSMDVATGMMAGAYQQFRIQHERTRDLPLCSSENDSPHPGLLLKLQRISFQWE